MTNSTLIETLKYKEVKNKYCVHKNVSQNQLFHHTFIKLLLYKYWYLKVTLAWNKSSLLASFHRKSLYHSLCMEQECWWNCKIHFVLPTQTEQWTRAKLKSEDNTTQNWTHINDNGKYGSSLNGANWKKSHYNPITNIYIMGRTYQHTGFHTATYNVYQNHSHHTAYH